MEGFQQRFWGKVHWTIILASKKEEWEKGGKSINTGSNWRGSLTEGGRQAHNLKVEHPRRVQKWKIDIPQGGITIYGKGGSGGETYVHGGREERVKD